MKYFPRIFSNRQLLMNPSPVGGFRWISQTGTNLGCASSNKFAGSDLVCLLWSRKASSGFCSGSGSFPGFLISKTLFSKLKSNSVDLDLTAHLPLPTEELLIWIFMTEIVYTGSKSPVKGYQNSLSLSPFLSSMQFGRAHQWCRE